MVKKTWFISLLLAPIFASCQPSTFDKVVIPFSDELKTIDGQYQSLTEYNQLQLMVEQEETFILMVGNATCGCTVEFLPIMQDWIDQTDILTYYIEYTKIEFQSEKFGIPYVTGSVPIINIFEDGELRFYRAYNPNRSSDNALFYDLSLLTSWFDERITLPNFKFLSKANVDALFTENKKFILYIGREDCPDCSYAFTTFLVPFLKTNPNLPTIYGLDVKVNGIRVPTVTGQESTTGNNTPGWSEFKANYGMDTTLNSTFGYATGFVPTFMYIETNGESIQANPLIIKDMVVTYNDSSLQDPTASFNAETNPRTTRLTRTYFDGSRPFAYTDLNLTELVLPTHNSTSELRDILRPYHNQAMEEFFDYYLPLVD